MGSDPCHGHGFLWSSVLGFSPGHCVGACQGFVEPLFGKYLKSELTQRPTNDEVYHYSASFLLVASCFVNRRKLGFFTSPLFGKSIYLTINELPHSQTDFSLVGL